MEQKVSSFPTYEELYERLKSEGVDEVVAAQNTKYLTTGLCPPLKERFSHWWTTGELLDDLEVKGYRISSFIKRRRFSVPGSFMNFNYLYENPDNELMLRFVRDGGRHRIIFSNK